VATPNNEEAEEQADEQPASDEVKETKPRLQYSRDDLMALKIHPLSILRPDCMDPGKNK
jgi:hypothetical protein